MKLIKLDHIFLDDESFQSISLCIAQSNSILSPFFFALCYSLLKSHSEKNQEAIVAAEICVMSRN